MYYDGKQGMNMMGIVAWTQEICACPLYSAFLPTTTILYLSVCYHPIHERRALTAANRRDTLDLSIPS